MDFNYTLTEKDFFNFHKKYILTSIKFNKFLIENFLILGLFFLIMFIFISSEFQIYVIVAFVESFLILFLLRKRWYLNCLKRKKFKNLHLYYNLKYIFTETNLKIDKKGILLETIFNKKIIKWKYINDLYIIDNNVLIRSFSDYNILIPASAINSNDDLQNLIKIFKENSSKYPQYSYPKDIEFI
ncbi:YcxB family protein [Clostridium botulinum]|uniref:YcxB family protein n=2 Tax=Clostridium botulinum TaxID=1491 RepID=C1FT41_CLOBJ|nr:YcxB family protein [Clostridium botulinum]ACO86213.1 hypothetical protein CLM_0673 [Clostridium botulinum A2 str. Kyoto]EPS53386.1 hypothetical protein CLQ_16190 [Clostridium botulinum Af84]